VARDALAAGEARDVIDITLPAGFLDTLWGAFDFIFNPRTSNVTGGHEVGGLAQIWPLMRAQIEVSAIALAGAIAVALPAGAYLGHRGRGEFLAVALGNAGRAVPEFAAMALLAAVIGVGLGNVAIALMILGVPPILTNSYVAVRQVDQGAVEAARGVGMTEREVFGKVEIPLAIPTIMTGIRTSAINIIATATIATFFGYLTLGDLIIGQAQYGTEGVLAGGILVALLALLVELVLAGVQRLLTPKGLRLQREGARA
jgi:osmoprotectant transport system permease protein